ncbi:MAG: hypothetical protein ACE5FN_04385 [Leptospirillia bacterium]
MTSESPENNPIYIIHHVPKTGGVSLRDWLAKHLGMYQGMAHYGVIGELVLRQNNLPYLEQTPAAFREGIRLVMGHYVTAATADFFPGRPPRRMVILREPVKRLISQYNHAMGFWCKTAGRPLISFHEWFETHAVESYDYRDAVRRDGLTPENAILSQASLGPNFMGRFLAQNFREDAWAELPTDEFVARINELLETFWLVGITERLSDFATVLGNALGIPADVGHENKGQDRTVYLEADDDLIEYIKQTNQADIAIYDYWKKKVESAA